MAPPPTPDNQPIHVRLAETDEELNRLAPVLRQLRPQYELDALITQCRRQQQDGYRLAYVEQDGEVLAVAGFVLGEKLAWQRHLYVDDLVTNENSRSRGAGHRLLEWLRQHALQHDCQQLHLDSGVQRFGAHKFYLREGFIINSHHFSITDLDAHQG